MTEFKPGDRVRGNPWIVTHPNYKTGWVEGIFMEMLTQGVARIQEYGATWGSAVFVSSLSLVKAKEPELFIAALGAGYISKIGTKEEVLEWAKQHIGNRPGRDTLTLYKPVATGTVETSFKLEDI